jgi:hypothetical protein
VEEKVAYLIVARKQKKGEKEEAGLPISSPRAHPYMNRILPIRLHQLEVSHTSQ